MPERLWLDRHWSAVLDAVLLAAAPWEGCALLLGRSQGSMLMIELVWPCLNVWVAGWPETSADVAASMPDPGAEEGPEATAAPSRRNRFAIDPREQLLAEKWARRQGLQVIGSAHSHPDGEAVPSAIDRAWVLPPTLMLIRSPKPGPHGWLGAWWFPGPPGESRRLVLIGDGDGVSAGAGDL